MICKKCAKRDSFEAISRAAKLTSQVANVRQSRRYDSYQKLPLCGPGPGGIDYAARARWRGAVPGRGGAAPCPGAAAAYVMPGAASGKYQ